MYEKKLFLLLHNNKCFITLEIKVLSLLDNFDINL